MKKMTLLLLMTLLVASCGEKANEGKSQSPIIVDYSSTWGVPFTSTPASSISSSSLRNSSKAVAKVVMAEGGSGTGFFISSDGLFITNNHVLPNLRCMKDACGGVKIIRDYHIGGDAEVFTVKEVIAQHEYYDFTILRVENPTGEKIPYLELSTQDISKRDTSLSIIGHPFGGALRLSNALSYDYDSYDDDYRLKSVAISGNSGSPVIHNHTGKVVGLYFAGGWDKSTVQVDGQVEHFGYAKRIEDILAFFPSGLVRGNGLSYSNIEVDESARPDLLEKAPVSFDTFMAGYYVDRTAKSLTIKNIVARVDAMNREKDYAVKVISSAKEKGYYKGDLYNLVSIGALKDFSSNRQKLLSKVASSQILSGEELSIRNRYALGMISQSQCKNEVEEKMKTRGTYTTLRDLLTNCDITYHYYDGDRIDGSSYMLYLAHLLAEGQIDEKNHQWYVNSIRYYLNTLNQYTNLRDTGLYRYYSVGKYDEYNGEREQIKQVALDLANFTTNYRSTMQAEDLATKVHHRLSF